MWRLIGFVLFASLLPAESTADPAYAALERAYAALRERSYDEAISGFRQALILTPKRADVQKDLAYTLLLVGDPVAAREAFAAAVAIEPRDTQATLEYAFLCHETKQTQKAREIFDRIRRTGNRTAEQAFQNIDRPLAEGITRWQQALAHDPDNFSGHEELARLAELRNEPILAARHYQRAWELKPTERKLLLDLGRVWSGMPELAPQGQSALLAASRGPEPRVAEAARELLPARYPYVYEFRDALRLDPENAGLHRELAYLLLEMKQQNEAELEFTALLSLAPKDRLAAAQLGFLKLGREDRAGALPLLQQVLEGPEDELSDRVRSALKLPKVLKNRTDTPRVQVSEEAAELAQRSLQAGYLPDALKYLHIAHENNPIDFPVILKLAWTYNLVHQDQQAIKWFDLARQSSDPAIAAEAARAYANLRGDQARWGAGMWLYPIWSSRWQDLFGYAQGKLEARVGWLRPYLSVRFVGDAKGIVGTSGPLALSENSVIPAVGLSLKPWRGLFAWGEVGEGLPFRGGKMKPDFRGGLSYSRNWGHALQAATKGLFFETNDDAVFVSRFGNDTLMYSQNRAGYTFILSEQWRAQALWNANVTTDLQRQPWANYIESGPGIRWRWTGSRHSPLFSVSLLRGVMMLPTYGAQRPNFWDLRVGAWYAISR